MNQLTEVLSYILPGKVYSEEDIKPICDILRQYPEDVKRHLGFTIADNQNDFWLFRLAMSGLGLRTKTYRKKNRVVGVEIDSEHYQFFIATQERRRKYREF